MSRLPKQFVTAYDYTNADGRLVFQHVRWRVGTDGKSFSYRYPAPAGPGWVWRKHPDADLYLYRLPELLAGKAAGVALWWCEGEKDADALVAAGQVVTTHHGGATKATPDQAAHFRGHTGWVVVLADNDPNGTGARCALRRVELLRAVGVPLRRIRVGRAAEGKDAADHLAAGLSPRDFVRQPKAELRAEVAALPTPTPGQRLDGYQIGPWIGSPGPGQDPWTPEQIAAFHSPIPSGTNREEARG